MRKVFAVLLALALLCGVALAESKVADLVTSYGLDPVNYDASSGYTLDYSADSKKSSSITWSDEEGTWLASGDTDVVAEAYVAALDLEAWESCRYVMGNKARISYGAKSGKQLKTLDDYKAAVCSALNITPAAAAPSASDDDALTYVLNTGTKKFHYPKCSSVKKIKSNNRKEYTGSRDDLIAKGYQPCGNCHP